MSRSFGHRASERGASKRAASEESDSVALVITALGAVSLLGGIVVGLLSPSADAQGQPIGGVVGSGIGVACGLWAFWSASVRAARAWSAARRRKGRAVGTVQGRSVDQRPSDYAYVEARVLRIGYPVGRRLLTLDWSPQPFHSNVGALMDRVDLKYPNGTEVVVHYDPARPENASVGHAVAVRLVTLPLIAVFVVGVALTGYFMTSAFMQLGAPASIESDAP